MLTIIHGNGIILFGFCFRVVCVRVTRIAITQRTIRKGITFPCNTQNYKFPMDISSSIKKGVKVKESCGDDPCPRIPWKSNLFGI